MKKSELKQLIREVIEEIADTDPLAQSSFLLPIITSRKMVKRRPTTNNFLALHKEIGQENLGLLEMQRHPSEVSIIAVP
jgi:hypothetical protein